MRGRLRRLDNDITFLNYKPQDSFESWVGARFLMYSIEEPAGVIVGFNNLSIFF